MKRFIIFSLVFSSLLTSAWSFNIQDRIATQNYFLQVYPHIFGDSDFALRSDFKKVIKFQRKRTRKKALALSRSLESFMPEMLLRPLIYWKVVKRDKQKTADILAYWGLYKLTILRDYLDNPLNPVEQKEKVRAFVTRLCGTAVKSDQFFSTFKRKFEKQLRSYAQLSSKRLIKSLEYDRLLGVPLNKIFPFMKNYSLSKYGIIPGNQVKIISKNTRTQQRIDWYNQRVVFHGGKLDYNLPYMKMPMSADEEGHIAFQTDPIFMQIRDMIHRATDSIFIDIFLFGGTLGGTIAEFLLNETAKKIKQNPEFKVLLLHDYATNYNMLPEMLPIFLHIRDRIQQESIFHNHFYFLQANIQRHPPGIPFGITDFMEKTPELFNAIEKRSTYFESKIDHSKVLVIDANTDHPEAYFGSKNWSDHSGGYYYDNVIWIKGPAAALVQASYYDDVQAALTTDAKEMAWFYYKDKGLDNRKYIPMKTTILNWFKIKRHNYSEQGTEPIRFAEANVDGKIKNVRNILIDMIVHAKNHIYMEELFIYDKYINDALIKKKIQNPALDIRILADHNGNFGMNGFPNTIFMRELISHGIKIKARRTLGIEAVFPDGATQEYHQENHRKICSVDGKVLLGGSSNLNPDTLQGSFREFGAQLFSHSEISKFESDFLQAWNDDEQTAELDIEHLKLKVGKKEFDIGTSHLINKFVSLLYRSKDFLEKKH